MKKFTWLFLIILWGIILFIPTFSSYAAIPMPNWKTRLINSDKMGSAIRTFVQEISIATDPSNFQHVCFLDPVTDTFRYRTNSSGHWRESSIVTFDSPYPLKHFNIVVTTMGKVLVVYSIADRLKLAVSETPGRWNSIDLHSGECFQNAIAAGPTEKIHVSFIQDRVLYYATSVGGRWTVFPVDNSGWITGDIAMAVDDAETVHIAYYDLNNRELKYAAKRTNKNQWETGSI